MNWAIGPLLITIGCVAFGYQLGRTTSGCEKPVSWNYQVAPHETQPEPTPALAPGRWIDERYEL